MTRPDKRWFVVGSAALLTLVTACTSGTTSSGRSSVASTSAFTSPIATAAATAPPTVIPPSPAPSSAPTSPASTPTPASPATTTTIVHPQSGPGTFTTSSVTYPAASTGRVVTYAVQVETGVPVDPSAFAEATHSTLTDPRGWQGVDHVAFQEVADPKAASFILTLATPKTTDKLCAPLDTGSWLDCFNRGRAVINSDRWLLGATSWGSNLAGYRQQVVNHEVGHAIGHNHLYCSGPGKPAPVMQQQTISLQGCAPNAWPSVTGG